VVVSYSLNLKRKTTVVASITFYAYISHTISFPSTAFFLQKETRETAAAVFSFFCLFLGKDLVSSC